MRTVKLQADFCVIGGGPAGMCAALAAARHGLSVVLMHDRPVPGGNASSEIRMWVCGAQGRDCRETGILEELALENLYRNPKSNMSIWDSVLYGKLSYQENLKLLLNTACQDATVKDGRIVSVKGFQSLTQSFYEVEAKYFADCSGDSILAALTPAQYRYGREARNEFDESIEPEVADRRTMGSSCLIQVRESAGEVKFIAPDWAKHYRKESDLPGYRNYNLCPWQNFWFIEIGGNDDVIHDAEAHREHLLQIAFGLWDYMKNYADDREERRNWELDWVGFLPGKRESRRYVGAYTMTQNDVTAHGRFKDIVAYGGWTMDDHHPDGFEYPGLPTVFHPAPSPFGIPYRVLYSANVPNLFCGGRNISVTHAALSAVRVMGTCATIGQAVGCAAALATRYHVDPHGVNEHIEELQDMLLDDDCWLPGKKRKINPLSLRASLHASNASDPEPLRDGSDRNAGEEVHSWRARCGDWVEYRWDEPQEWQRIRLVFDSELNREERSTVAVRRLDRADSVLPPSLVKEFVLEFRDESGHWRILKHEKGNYQRLLRLQLPGRGTALRLTVLDGWGMEELAIFGFEVQDINS